MLAVGKHADADHALSRESSRNALPARSNSQSNSQRRPASSKRLKRPEPRSRFTKAKCAFAGCQRGGSCCVSCRVYGPIFESTNQCRQPTRRDVAAGLRELEAGSAGRCRIIPEAVEVDKIRQAWRGEQPPRALAPRLNRCDARDAERQHHSRLEQLSHGTLPIRYRLGFNPRADESLFRGSTASLFAH